MAEPVFKRQPLWQSAFRHPQPLVLYCTPHRRESDSEACLCRRTSGPRRHKSDGCGDSRVKGSILSYCGSWQASSNDLVQSETEEPEEGDPHVYQHVQPLSPFPLLEKLIDQQVANDQRHNSGFSSTGIVYDVVCTLPISLVIVASPPPSKHRFSKKDQWRKLWKT